ncbi:hypothetical protein [Streptomyces sp. 900105245]
MVRAQDAAIPTHRRAPRTLGEMRARLAGLYEDEQDACGLCGNWKCTCGQARVETAGRGLMRTRLTRLTASLRHMWQCAECGLWSDTPECQHC